MIEILWKDLHHQLHRHIEPKFANFCKHCLTWATMVLGAFCRLKQKKYALLPNKPSSNWSYQAEWGCSSKTPECKQGSIYCFRILLFLWKRKNVLFFQRLHSLRETAVSSVCGGHFVVPAIHLHLLLKRVSSTIIMLLHLSYWER